MEAGWLGTGTDRGHGVEGQTETIVELRCRTHLDGGTGAGRSEAAMAGAGPNGLGAPGGVCGRGDQRGRTHVVGARGISGGESMPVERDHVGIRGVPEVLDPL